jgi:hypothetical protein
MIISASKTSDITTHRDSVALVAAATVAYTINAVQWDRSRVVVTYTPSASSLVLTVTVRCVHGTHKGKYETYTWTHVDTTAQEQVIELDTGEWELTFAPTVSNANSLKVTSRNHR